VVRFACNRATRTLTSTHGSEAGTLEMTETTGTVVSISLDLPSGPIEVLAEELVREKALFGLAAELAGFDHAE
jgi:hypothetical protein